MIKTELHEACEKLLSKIEEATEGPFDGHIVSVILENETDEPHFTITYDLDEDDDREYEYGTMFYLVPVVVNEIRLAGDDIEIKWMGEDIETNKIFPTPREWNEALEQIMYYFLQGLYPGMR